MTVRRLQVIRRIVQVGVVALMVAVPVVSRYTNYLSARELDKNLEKWAGTLQGEALRAVDSALRALPGGEEERVGRMVRDRTAALERAQGLRGGPWSMQIGAVSMTDPLAGAESIAASRKVAPVLVIGLAIPLVATLLLGRIFCSWICPMGFLFELSERLRGVLRYLELHPWNLGFSRATKYTLLGLGLVVTLGGGVPILGTLYPPAMVNRETHDLVFGMFDRAEQGKFGLSLQGLTWMTGILIALVAFEATVSRRWWCRYVCPGGALYSLFGRRRLVRVRRDAGVCTSCGVCVQVCPMGLDPMHDAMGQECDNCGVCVSNCSDAALGFAVTTRDASPGRGNRTEAA